MFGFINSPIKSLCTFCALSLLFISSASFSFDADVTISSKSVQFSTASAGVKSVSIKVWGPDGALVFSQTSAGSSITWNLANTAADGRYKYQAKLSDVVAGSRSRSNNSVQDSVKPIIASESGSVLVQSGSIVIPAEEQAEDETGLIQTLENSFQHLAGIVLNGLIAPAHADQVINDDAIIEFSLCVGQDCVDGETFGRDTIRLRENNLRIHFDDTSSTSSFPNNDWRIIINDGDSGGSNFFGIEDASAGRQILSLEAGAPTDSLYIDNNGRVGFGTPNPVTAIEAVVGSTPTLRLNQDGSFGFTPQSWDVAGNETGFFIRDVSNGLTLPFFIEPGAATDSLYVSSAGNIGMGIDSPTEKLHVVGNAVISGNLELGSSRSIKNQIHDLGLNQAIDALLALQPVMFKYNHSPQQQSIGFIAEDVPDLVASASRKSLKPMDIVAVLTKVVQAQQQVVETQQAAINELSEKMDRLLNEKNSK